MGSEDGAVERCQFCGRPKAECRAAKAADQESNERGACELGPDCDGNACKPSSDDRFGIVDKPTLAVTDPDLDGRVRLLALGAMDMAKSADEKDAVLRCLINHCEDLIGSFKRKAKK